MRLVSRKNQIALAAIAALGAAAVGGAPTLATAGKVTGNYVTGDFHNHTTCSDGSISMQKLVRKSTETSEGNYGLDWFVQAGHGGNGNRNCTLVEDASLATPAYPVTMSADGTKLLGPTTTWQNSNPAVQPKGTPTGTAPNQNMWRWQSLQEFQYPLLEYLSRVKNTPLFLGLESVVAGHEHGSMSVITGQMPLGHESHRGERGEREERRGGLPPLPTTAGYVPLGNANALAQWEYCFDRADSDLGRGNATVGTTVVPGGNNWSCEVPGSNSTADANWNATGQKLTGNAGLAGHLKTLEGIKWMAKHHPDTSYYVPAHLERAGPFNPAGSNGYNIEHLRNFNNAGPRIAFGFETQPGHGASSDRGEYAVNRNTIGGVKVDSVGGTTWGGTGIYGAQIGGVWDALLGEGRNWWFFASSDWHNRGSFSADDRRSTQDFLPGEYQRTAVMVRNGGDAKLRPQQIVDGLRTGNAFSASGQLIDRLAFVACIGNPGAHGRSEGAVQALAINAALKNTDLDFEGCATMGEKLVVPKGADVVVSIVVRDPAGKNNSPYTFANPSLLQIGVKQPINMPVLDHVDVIGGKVGGYKNPAAPDYAGQWPNTWLADWLASPTQAMANVPAGAKNTTARLMKTFNASTWKTVDDFPEFKAMTFRIKSVGDSQYVRLRGSNLPAGVPYETDADGNAAPDLWTNASDKTKLRIACTTVGTNVPTTTATYTGTDIDGCPAHLPTVTNQMGVVGYPNGYSGKMVAYDVAAWSDLWFYSNPIFVEVSGSTMVAGVK